MMKNKQTPEAHLTGFTHYNTKPGTGDEFVKMYEDFAARSIDEEGCLHFELFQSQHCDTCFIIYHKWRSSRDWEEHLNQVYTSEFILQINDMVESVVILEATDTPDSFV